MVCDKIIGEKNHNLFQSFMKFQMMPQLLNTLVQIRS